MTDAPAMGPPRISARDLRAALAISASWLERNADAINALNVFPVPDGDTGLNMSLTLRAAVDEAESCQEGAVAAVLHAVGHGALMGARGNSGVILAQLLRGMGRPVTDETDIDGPLFAAMLAAGSEAAYQAVGEPVEGTILTVARAAADAASAMAQRTAGFTEVLDAAHAAARVAVDRTPEQLVVLAEAGVVDAGGEGFRVFLEGLLLHLRGESIEDRAPRITRHADLPAMQHGADNYGYCTEVLFRPEAAEVKELRERVATLGSSVLVVGDGDLVKIHVHTLRPGAALELATELGEIVRVKVDNMRLQYRSFAAVTPVARPIPGVSVVAVAVGSGFQEIFASMNAIVVTGGQSMNPAVGEIVAAIERAPREQVVVLPNNRNVILAAEQAAKAIAGHRVTVLPTRSMCQGIAAALAMSPESEDEPDLVAVLRAAERCVTIELTRAARHTEVAGETVTAGGWIAVVDDQLVAGTGDAVSLIGRVLETLPPREFELATIYLGIESTDTESGAIRDLIATRIDVPVELVQGGQPHYPYIISLE